MRNRVWALAVVVLTAFGTAVVSAVAMPAGASSGPTPSAPGWAAIPAAARLPIATALVRDHAAMSKSKALQQKRIEARAGRTNDFFAGYSGVAISGDTIVVGAPGRGGNRGIAFVFRRPASGWAHVKQVATLSASNGVAKDLFGRGVAIAGDTIAVAAPGHAVAANAGQGVIDVFVQPKHGWSGPLHESAVLTAGDGKAGDQLGYDAVAASGDTIVAGSSTHEVGTNLNQGAVYVFVRPRAGWSGHRDPATELLATDGRSGDYLSGEALDISGRTVVAGAGTHQVGANESQGAVYVFVRAAAGWPATHQQTSELTARHGSAGGYLGGTGVAVSGRTVVAGSTDLNVGGNGDQGVGYVFVRPKSGWPARRHESANLIASNGSANDQMGSGVAVSGNTVLMTAPGKGINGRKGQGAVYRFVSPANGWSGTRHQTAELVARDGRAFDSFGDRSVAMSGTTAVIGCSLHQVHSHPYQGAAYIFAPRLS